MRKLLDAKVWLGLCLAVCFVPALAPAVSGACTYSLSPGSRSHGYGAATNTIIVSAGTGCDWSVTNFNGWITILSGASGTGTGTVTYAVSANAAYAGRTGVVTIASQTFTIQQDQFPCTYNVAPTTRTHGYGTANNNFAVQANINCGWSVVNTSLWVNFTAVTNGFGSNTVSYDVLANPTPIQRTGNVVVADQVFALIQHAAPCLYELSPTNRIHGYGGSTGLVTVTATSGCLWNVDNSNSWIHITANPSGTNNGSFGYVVDANPLPVARNGSPVLWDQVFGVFQQPAPCTASLAPTSASPDADAQTNTVTVSTASGCAWTAASTNNWLTFDGSTNGVGDGSVAWVVALNPSIIGRTGVVSIAGQNFTVRQDGFVCSYHLSPTNRVHGYAATTNSVSLSTLSTCPWTVSNTNPWINILSSTNGTGDAVITYALSANGNTGDRFGMFYIGGQTFLITQHGVGCAVGLSPSSRTHGYGTATNSITVTIGASCDWNVVNTNTWLTIQGATNGTGNGSVTYAVAANPSSQGRSGYLGVNEGLVLISQNGAPCVYSISPTNYDHTPLQETGTVSVATPTGCSWTVDNTNSWVTILSGTNGSGNGLVSYQVTTNYVPGARAGIITIAGQIYGVSQDGVLCIYKLSTTNRTHGYGATTNALTMTVSNPCPWTASSTNNWISIVSGSSGVGIGTVTYALTANSLTPFDRIGSIQVDGQVCIITQHGYPCSFTLVPGSRNHGYGAATNSVSFSSAAGCPWSAAASNNWITILSGTSGTATGTVTYAVAANTNSNPRGGSIFIGDQTFAITQAGATNGGGSAGLALDSIVISSTGTVVLTLVGTPLGVWEIQSSPNISNWTKIGNATNSTGRTQFVAPAGGSGPSFYRAMLSTSICSFVLSPPARTHGYGATTNSVDVSGSGTCAWNVVNTNSWVTILSGGSGTNSGTVTYSVTANTDLVDRSGTILIGDQYFNISQAAYLCTYKLSPTNRTHGFGLTTNSATITAGPACDWAILNTNDWIAITTPLTGTGNSNFNYTVQPNFGTTSRTGQVTLADQVLVVIQLPSTSGFVFESVSVAPNGAVTLKLNGGPPGIWQLQSSLNLTNWTKVSDLTNTTGRVEYTVPGPAGSKRFFRAVLP